MFEPIIIIDPMTTIIIRRIFDSTMYFIEGLIICYFALKYFKIKKHWIIYSIFAFIYSFTAKITSLSNIINLPFSILAIIYTYVLLSSSDKKYDNYQKMFIAIFIQLIVSICNNASIFRAIFILKPVVNHTPDYSQYSIIISNDISYYLFYIIARILIFFILKKILSKNFTDSTLISSKYWTGFSILSIIIMVINSYTLENIYFGTFNQNYIYLIMISYLATILIIFYLFITLQNESQKHLKKDLEIIQLKNIQDQYINLKNQKERNDKIKHDLEYFLKLVKNHQNADRLEPVLLNTINNLNEQEITIYCQNQIINSLLCRIKEIAKENNKNIFFNINIDDIELSLDTYNQIIEFTKDLCNNDLQDEISVNVKRINNYCTFEFIFITNQLLDFKSSDNEKIIISHEKNINHDIIKFLIKL